MTTKRIAYGLLALVLCAGLVSAQVNYYDRVASGLPNVNQISAVQVSQTGLLVQYIGTNSLGGNVTVDGATGDLTFTVGAVGASAADTSLECPVSGALGGVIDVSNAACNTIGEVVDIINGSADWVAVPISLLRADSSDNTLFTLAETAATAATGLALQADQAVLFEASVAILPTEMLDIRAYYNRVGGGGKQLVQNPYNGWRGVFNKGIFTSTYGSGTSGLYVYSVRRSLGGAADTVSTMWGPEAGGATTAAKTFDFTPIGGLFCRPDELCLVRLDNSAAMTAVVGTVQGSMFQYRQP